MDYQAALSYLYSLGHEVLAAKFGLENIQRLLDALGHPERAFKSVIVAGTNGKGSTAAMLESIVMTAGHRTGLLTSPHLVRIEERMRVAGEEISPADFARHATTVRAACEQLVAAGELEQTPTFFEQVTAIAMLHFREQRVELAILEVGLGGRLDSTNAVERILSIVTAIDFDHQNILGYTIAEIAAEKAAIIQADARAVIGRQKHDKASDVLMRRCLETSVLPVFANPPLATYINELGRISFDYESARSHYTRVTLGLRGRHQAENAAATIEAAEILTDLGFTIPREAIIKGLRNARWPGRLEFIEDRPALLLDGAHNPAGARVVRAYLDEFWHGPVTLVFGAMGDKDIDAMTAVLFGAADTIVLTRVPDARAASTARLGKSALDASRKVIFTETVSQAMSWARSLTPADGLICVAGSLHLVGAVKKLLEEEDQQSAVM